MELLPSYRLLLPLGEAREPGFDPYMDGGLDVEIITAYRIVGLPENTVLPSRMVGNTVLPSRMVGIPQQGSCLRGFQLDHPSLFKRMDEL